MRCVWRTTFDAACGTTGAPTPVVAIGVATATAVLTGALLVGDSMRTSLRSMALSRLGGVDHAMVGNRYVDQQLATALVDSTSPSLGIEASPLIIESAGIVHADTRARANQISVFGVEPSFWRLATSAAQAPIEMPTGRIVWINEPLARALDAAPGDDVLVRIGKPAKVSTETLLGRRDDTALTLRLTVERVVTAREGGEFALTPSQSTPYNAWIPLRVVQRRLDQTDRVNAILVRTDSTDAGDDSLSTADRLDAVLQRAWTPSDLGLDFRVDEPRGYIALESDRLLLEPEVEAAVIEVAGDVKVLPAPVLTYLANAIGIESVTDADANPVAGATAAPPRAIPYSTVAAVDVGAPGAPPLVLADGSPAPVMELGEILLNEWAAEDLDARVGDRVRLSYFLTSSSGSSTRTPSPSCFAGSCAWIARRPIRASRRRIRA